MKMTITLIFLLTSCFCYSQGSDDYIKQGNDKFDLKNFSGAIQDYSKAIELNHKDADVFIKRGNAKYEILDYLGSIEDYTKAIELNPNDANAYFNRALSMVCPPINRTIFRMVKK